MVSEVVVDVLACWISAKSFKSYTTYQTRASRAVCFSCGGLLRGLCLRNGELFLLCSSPGCSWHSVFDLGSYKHYVGDGHYFNVHDRRRLRVMASTPCGKIVKVRRFLLGAGSEDQDWEYELK